MNPELQGRVFPPAEPYLVGREKVREFASAVFSTSPLNFDADAAAAAGFPDVVAPPTFAVVVQERTLAQLLAAEDAGIDFSRVVHGDQRFSYSRPIVAGDELTGHDAAAILSRIVGRTFTYYQIPIDVVRQRMGEDAAKMYEWFDRVGFTVDRAALRREFPDVTFHDFESWAKTQDWNALLQRGG